MFTDGPTLSQDIQMYSVVVTESTKFSSEIAKVSTRKHDLGGTLENDLGSLNLYNSC